MTKDDAEVINAWAEMHLTHERLSPDWIVSKRELERIYAFIEHRIRSEYVNQQSTDLSVI